MIIDISFSQGTLFGNPTRLLLNGLPYSLIEQSSIPLKYAGPAQEAISFIEFPSDDGPYGLPREISVLNRIFLRRCENFYTPSNASPSEIEQFFDYVSHRYEHTIDLSLNRKLIHKMLDVAQDHATGRGMSAVRVLDFGCGTGLSWLESRSTRRQAPQILLYGCDLSECMVQFSRKRGFKTVEKCSYAKTEFADGSFDVIICSFVVHYFVDVRPFGEMKRILRPDGLLIFNLPHYESGEQLDYYRGVLQDAVGSTRSTKWTLHTSKARMLPIVRYRALKPQRPQNKKSPPEMPPLFS